jgi:hypothetical protein
MIENLLMDMNREKVQEHRMFQNDEAYFRQHK